MAVYEARLLCVHPLCHRWRDHRKEVRTFAVAESASAAAEIARGELAQPGARKCKECRRPIALRHLQIWKTDGNGNSTVRVFFEERTIA